MEREFRTGVFGTAPGHPTDDSTLAVLAAEAVLDDGDGWVAGYARRLVAWAESGPPDIGNQTAHSYGIGPFDALVELIARGGDTDTNAAVARALLGARYGTGAWPPHLVDQLHLAPRLVQLADRLWPARVGPLIVDRLYTGS